MRGEQKAPGGEDRTRVGHVGIIVAVAAVVVARAGGSLCICTSTYPARL